MACDILITMITFKESLVADHGLCYLQLSLRDSGDDKPTTRNWLLTGVGSPMYKRHKPRSDDLLPHKAVVEVSKIRNYVMNG